MLAQTERHCCCIILRQSVCGLYQHTQAAIKTIFFNPLFNPAEQYVFCSPKITFSPLSIKTITSSSTRPFNCMVLRQLGGKQNGSKHQTQGFRRACQGTALKSRYVQPTPQMLPSLYTPNTNDMLQPSDRTMPYPTMNSLARSSLRQ